MLPKTKSIQDAYNDWKDSFLVQMTLANVFSVLEDSYVAPTASTDADERTLDERMQNIVKASIMTATMGTLAAAFLDNKDDGRTIFFKLRSTYKSKDSQQEAAEAANKAFGLLSFGKTTKLTTEGFSLSFMRYVQQMQDNGSPLAPVLMKSTFLGKIQHPAYATFKAIKNANDELFAVTLFCFHAWAQDLRAANGGTDPGNDANVKNVNNAKQRGGNNKNKNNKKGKGKGKGNKHGDYILKEEWAKLGKEGQDAVHAKRSAAKGETPPSNIPMQYGGHSMLNQMLGTPPVQGTMPPIPPQDYALPSQTYANTVMMMQHQMQQQQVPSRGGMSINNLHVKLLATIQSRGWFRINRRFRRSTSWVPCVSMVERIFC
jgi:hypothetical protein